MPNFIRLLSDNYSVQSYNHFLELKKQVIHILSFNNVNNFIFYLSKFIPCFAPNKISQKFMNYLNALQSAINLSTDSNLKLTPYQSDYLSWFIYRYRNMENFKYVNLEIATDVLDQMETEYNFWRLRQVFKLAELK